MCLLAIIFTTNNLCFSQEKETVITIENDFNYFLMDNSIPSNQDIMITFKVTNPNNYIFSYQLDNDTPIALTNLLKSDKNFINYKLPRNEFNKKNVAKITFIRTDKNDAKKSEAIEISINKISLAKGNIIDDAIALQNAKDNEQLVIDILSFYANKELSLDALKELINENPYLKDLISIKNDNNAKNELFVIKSVGSLTGTLKQNYNSSITGIQSGGLAGVDVTKYANALADVMIDHAKQELTIAFFNRFKNFINEHEEFRILFPKTTDKLENLLSYKYPEMIKALREVFHEDIRMIAFRIDDVFALPKYQLLTENYPEITLAIRSLRLVHQLETGGLNAAGVLNVMSNFSEWNNKSNSNKFKNIGNALKVANTLNNSVSYVEEGELKWHESEKIAKLFEDEVVFKIYMGLLYEKEKNTTNPIAFIQTNGTSIPFLTVLENQKDNLFFFQNKIQEFTDLNLVLKKTIKEIKDKANKTTNEDLNKYMTVSIDVIEYGISLYDYFDKSIEVSDEYVAILRLSNAIYKNVYEEQYNAAISNSIDLFSKIIAIKNDKYKINEKEFNAIEKITEDKDLLKIAKDLKEDSFETKATEINNLVAVITNQDLKNKIEDFKNNNDNDKKQKEMYESFLDIIQKLKPYALFMANMIEAKDEKEVKAALDAVILPVGSSSIKKHSIFNFNVQSYLGARLSFTNPKTAIQNTWNDTFAISAPIGLSISHGFNNNWGAITLFAPILDLGAIVDYKLKYENEGTANESLESKDYTIKLGQIFSPGAYLVYGFGANIPLSLGFGGQYGPGLSKISEDSTTEISNPYWKWNVFLSVDIPLFNLSNKAKVK
ncbi:hypothetical protein FIA58_004640 [Flavobacterium jejuense]|uniref:Uncharacterized protein n=1 Tax=Flavobacterium jejuense TaxID=1544455 RepID=A0ABX0IMB8_9FLAO|nr:hypothetical protein [Flavobacterium jejuense]NHN24959.1 hypothetical protein [Flavobacterium jejuense]